MGNAGRKRARISKPSNSFMSNNMVKIDKDCAWDTSKIYSALNFEDDTMSFPSIEWSFCDDMNSRCDSDCDSEVLSVQDFECKRSKQVASKRGLVRSKRIATNLFES